MIEFSDRATEALANMDLENPDRTLTNVSLECCWGPFNDKKTGQQVNKGGFSFDWMSKSAGCGRLTFYVTNEDEIRCYNQMENKDFIKEVFAKFLEDVKLDG
jgi:hypothetical protein